MSDDIIKDYEIEEEEATPFFDVELILRMQQERRMDGETLNTLSEAWQRMADALRMHVIYIKRSKYLLVWLEEAAETMVAEAWEESPNDGFLIQNMAQAMLMSVIREEIPEIAADGCAPAPKPFPSLMAAMAEAGVEWDTDTTLSRQFAMITHLPYKGGCAVCYLSKTCPNAKLAH